VHNLLTEQLDTAVLLLVELIGSVVISLSRCCLPNDEGPGPQIFFPRTATAVQRPFLTHTATMRRRKIEPLYFNDNVD